MIFGFKVTQSHDVTLSHARTKCIWLGSISQYRLSCMYDVYTYRYIYIVYVYIHNMYMHI